MKTILATTDFSPSSVNAVRYAADLAQFVDAQLVICTVIQFPMPVSEIPVPELTMDDMVEVGNKELDDLVENIRGRSKNKISLSRELLTGTVEQQIREIAERYTPLCVVMGIKHGKNLARALFGSTIFQMLNHIPYPLLIIPEFAQLGSIKEIGFACDLKDLDETIPFTKVKEWINLFKAKLDIIHVSNKDSFLDPGKASESLCIKKHFKSFNPEFYFLSGSSLTDELQDFIRLYNPGLLIIVPKIKHGFPNFTEKSKSRTIIKYNQVPILAIPAQTAIYAN